jgi:hypothetical protein
LKSENDGEIARLYGPKETTIQPSRSTLKTDHIGLDHDFGLAGRVAAKGQTLRRSTAQTLRLTHAADKVQIAF